MIKVDIPMVKVVQKYLCIRVGFEPSVVISLTFHYSILTKILFEYKIRGKLSNLGVQITIFFFSNSLNENLESVTAYGAIVSVFPFVAPSTIPGGTNVDVSQVTSRPSIRSQDLVVISICYIYFLFLVKDLNSWFYISIVMRS